MHNNFYDDDDDDKFNSARTQRVLLSVEAWHTDENKINR